MTKYYIDTSLSGTIEKATLISGENYVKNSEYCFEYDIAVRPANTSVVGSNSWSTFMSDILIDGESIYYEQFTRDLKNIVIIPAGTVIENQSTSNEYKYCRVIPYQTQK